MEILIQITDNGTGPNSSRIDSLDYTVATNTIVDQDVVATPAAGKALQYPVSAHGNLIYYEVGEGQNVNLNADAANIFVNGTKRLRPTIPGGFLNLLVMTWGPAGHGALTPNNKIIHHARVERKLFGLLQYTEPTWFLVETDLTLSANSHRIISAKDWVEPSVAEDGRLTYIDKTFPLGGQHKVVSGGVKIPTPGFAFDPVVSPDGSKVAWLVLEGADGSTVLQNIFPVKWSLFVSTISTPSPTRVVNGNTIPGTLTSHPFWLDDGTLCATRLSNPFAPWRAIRVDVTTSVETFITEESLGSVGMIYPVHS